MTAAQGLFPAVFDITEFPADFWPTTRAMPIIHQRFAVWQGKGSGEWPQGANWMSDEAASIESLYRQGIRYFNDCEFFEAHETWEELWTEYRGPARRFYQGLIQAAVALHHFGNGNIRGAKKVYLTSRDYLQDYRPAYAGLDLEAFLAQYERCFADVLSSTEEIPRIDIDPELIPEIHLEEEVST